MNPAALGVGAAPRGARHGLAEDSGRWIPSTDSTVLITRGLITGVCDCVIVLSCTAMMAAFVARVPLH